MRLGEAVELHRGWDDRLYLPGKRVTRVCDWDGDPIELKVWKDLFRLWFLGVSLRYFWKAQGRLFPMDWVNKNGEYLGPVVYVPESVLHINSGIASGVYAP